MTQLGGKDLGKKLVERRAEIFPNYSFPNFLCCYIRSKIKYECKDDNLNYNKKLVVFSMFISQCKPLHVIILVQIN